MGSETIINQVLEEIRQSIFLINESFGSEKCETSSFSNFSLSTILDICDIRIVDELPPVTSRSENLFVIPFEETLNNQVTSQLQNHFSNFIVLTSPSTISHSNENVNRNYTDDCESTSEGSFLTDNEIEDRTNEFESDFDIINQNIKSNTNSSLENDEFLSVNKQHNYLDIFSCNHINSSNEEHFQREFSSICDCNIGIQSSELERHCVRNVSLFRDSCLRSQNDTKSIPINSPELLKKRINDEINDEERDYKLIKCDSHLFVENTFIE